MILKLQRGYVLRLGLFIFLFFGVSLVFTGTAKADFNSLPTIIPHSGAGTDDPSYLQFFNLSNGANDQKTGKGADVPNGYIKVYGQDSGARPISFGVAVRRIGEDKACKGYNIRWRVHRLDASGVTSSIGPYSTIPINRCTIGPSHSGSYNFTVPAGQLNLQTVPGHAGIYEAIIQLNLQDDTNNDGFNDTARNSDGTPVTKSATLRINAGAGGKIGYAGGGYEANVYPSYDQGFDHVMSYRFRPACTLSGPTTINLEWRDDDYQAPSPNPPGSPDGDGNGTENQYDSPRARVYEYDYAGNSTGNAGQRNTFYDNGPPNNRGGTTITARPGYRYILKLESVDGGNGVIFKYPYDTGNFELPCPPNQPTTGASCTTAVASPINGTTNGVQAGSDFQVAFTVTNNGSTVLSTPDYGVTFFNDDTSWQWNRPGGPNHFPVPYALAPGASVTYYGTFRADSALTSRTIPFYPDHIGVGPVGASCPLTVESYARYDFAADASSSMRPDNESPTGVEFRTSLVQQGTDVNGTSTRTFYKQRAGANSGLPGFGPYSESINFGSRNYVDTYSIPGGSYQVGDTYCAHIILDYGHGWKGPNGKYANESAAEDSNCSQAVVNHPYMRTYGADTAVGGGFTGDCGRPAPPAEAPGIFAYMRPLNEHNGGDNRSGSGAQLATFALGRISGFESASIRTTNPLQPKGLTFGHNNGLADQTSIDPLLGGDMSGDGWCMPNFFEETQFTDDNTLKNESSIPGNINVTAASLTDYGQTVRNLSPSGKLRIIGSNSQTFTGHHTVFVDGDVFILNNIMYPSSYGSNISSIPSFTLVVKGNIYIDNDVTQLDGLYIAQPDGASGGRIYTCATENSGDNPVTSPNAIYNECGGNESGLVRQLRVNGAFIAQRLVLNRASYSLRNSAFRELAGTSRATEIFNFSPEMYLSPPVFRPNGTPTSGEYDYITTLPPIL